MVMLTTTAAVKLKDILVAEGAADKGLRIRVVPGGCSGYSYDMVFDDAAEGDNVFEHEGVKLLVDAESMPLLTGAEIDFEEQLGHEGFKIKNPNATSGCGCGKSFQN